MIDTVYAKLVDAVEWLLVMHGEFVCAFSKREKKNIEND